MKEKLYSGDGSIPTEGTVIFKGTDSEAAAYAQTLQEQAAASLQEQAMDSEENDSIETVGLTKLKNRFMEKPKYFDPYFEP